MAENKQTTHAVTTPNTRPPTQIETLRANITNPEGAFLKSVIAFYGGNKDEAMRFSTAAVEYVRRVPKLLNCDAVSLMASFAISAQFKFLPSGVSGEAYIIPYGNEAKFQLGYQGIVTLLYRTGKIKAISANIVYKNDTFEYEEGLNPILKHKFSPFASDKDRGEAIGVYTIAEMDGTTRTFKVMGKDAIMKIKNMSKAKASKESPWNSNDPEMWMWKKTCLIQHAKLLPKTPDLIRAIEKDFDGEGIDKGNLDAGGPAVGASFHNPENIRPEIVIQKDIDAPKQTFKEAAHKHAEKQKPLSEEHSKFLESDPNYEDPELEGFEDLSEEE